MQGVALFRSFTCSCRPKLLVGTLGTGVGDVGVPVSVFAGMVSLVVEVRAGVTVRLVELELTLLHSEEMPSNTSCALLSEQGA